MAGGTLERLRNTPPPLPRLRGPAENAHTDPRIGSGCALGWAGLVPHRALKSGCVRMKNSQTRIFSLVMGNLVICSLSQLYAG